MTGTNSKNDAALERFEAYARTFDLENERIRLKVDHMLAVADIIVRIACSLDADARVLHLAYVCGLFHDIGRFEQVKRYGTFSDAASRDHAELGLEVIESEGLLDFLDPADKEAIIVAIHNHNKFAIDPGVSSEPELTLCKLIRDADKTDIYRVFATEDTEAITGAPREEVEQAELSPEVAESLLAHRCVVGRLRKTPLDKLAAVLGFIYDVNYPETYRIMLEQGHYRSLFARIEHVDEGTQRLLTELVDDASAYMKK